MGSRTNPAVLRRTTFPTRRSLIGFRPVIVTGSGIDEMRPATLGMGGVHSSDGGDSKGSGAGGSP